VAAERLANGRPRNQRRPHQPGRRSPGCTGLSGAPSNFLVCRVTNGRLRQKRKKNRLLCSVRCVPESPVHPRTKSNQGLQNEDQTTLLVPWGYKKTPYAHGAVNKALFEHTTTLNFCDHATVLLERDLSAFLSCNSIILFRALSLFTCVRVVVALCSCVHFYSHSYSSFVCNQLCKA
jgi:hypothetical protein